eukprot:m.114685 g.114685  ORF g.114685 m.114685 type:complete len:113 (-) comp17120_c0_seq3:87-425(-)
MDVCVCVRINAPAFRVRSHHNHAGWQATVSRVVDATWMVTCIILRLQLHYDVGTTIVSHKSENLDRFGGLFWLAIVGTWLVFLTDIVFTGQFIASRLSIYFGINSSFNKKVM